MLVLPPTVVAKLNPNLHEHHDSNECNIMMTHDHLKLKRHIVPLARHSNYLNNRDKRLFLI